MLIGIDMLGVQSSPEGGRESARLGRQLVRHLIALGSEHRYVLYAHEGLPTEGIPSARNALRVSLAPVSNGSYHLRPTIQRVLDANPDGLDWLILLDPFDELYGGLPPESPLNGLKLASVVLDLSPEFADDRRIAPLRRHDAILAASDAVADDARKRLGSASARVTTIGVASDNPPTDTSDPLTRAEADELGRLGISGPFLLASVAEGADRSNLPGILEAYTRLPIEHRMRHQLAIAGRLDDPWGVIGQLHENGCAEGLVLVGEPDERALRTLYARCSAYLSPATGRGSGLSLVEAMRSGAPIVAGPSQIVGEAGLIVDPSDPAEIAARLAGLLSDVDLQVELRSRSRERSARFAWGPVAEGVLAALSRDAGPVASRPDLRVDQAHVVRPRIAVFTEQYLPDPAEVIPAGWREGYRVDLYLEDAGLADGLPADLGGFDARQFGRNDAILGYHAVVHRVDDAGQLDATLAGLKARPGLVILLDDAFLDRIGPDPAGDDEEFAAETRLRELFLTSSLVALRSSGHRAAIRAIMPEFAGRLIDLAETSTAGPIERCAAELARGSGRSRPRRIAGLRGMASTPHSRRTSSPADEAAVPVEVSGP